MLQSHDDTICQSCGMPMAAVEHFGTNLDKSPNEDYCCFCFQKGDFTNSFNLDESILDSLQYHDESEKINGCTLTKDEAAVRMRAKLPNLKRWQSHQFTHLEYHKSINKAVDYINNNLANDINLSLIAEAANISYFHFHRIFKAVINESPGEYIQRLRLEKAAFKLKTTSLPLSDIAEQIGYQSLHALSKAFKKRFNISPSAYKKKPMDLAIPINAPIDDLHICPTIKTIKPIEVIYTRVINPFVDKNAFQIAWRNLLHFVNADGIPNEQYQYFCLSRDISTITTPDKYRIYACINTLMQTKLVGRFGKQCIDGGMYAVFTHKGSYRSLDILYSNIYRYWIPKSQYHLRDNTSFEKYLNNPELVCEDDLLTEIYIPISKI